MITQNDPADFPTLIANGKLLPANLAASTPQKLIICRQIIANTPPPNVTYIFAPGSEIIFTTSTSGLVIAPFNSVQMRGTHVHGCSQLWNSIEIGFNGRLDLVQGCVVEDAVNAIQLNQGGIFTSSLTEFKGNYTSIHAGQADVAPTIVFGGFSVHSTTFSGSKPLLNAVSIGGITHTKPNMGVFAENVSAITLGVAGAGTNLFRDFSASTPVRGARAANSNLTVVNSRFLNIGFDETAAEGFGVSGFSLTSAQKITILGLGSLATSTPTFENVGRAFSGESTRLSVSQCRVLRCQTGIFVGKLFEAPLGVFSININNCRIEEICFNGIFLENTMPSRSVSIADNKILCNSTNTSCGQKNGIRVRSGSMGNATGYTLIRNEITGISPIGSALRGITLENVSNLKAELNTIVDQNTSNELRFSGISLNKCPSTILKDNVITGNKINYSLPESAGILNKESGNTVMSCNYVNNINQGVAFYGPACDGTDMNSTSIGTHNEGLFLESGTIMGDQDKKNNTWASGPAEARFNFIGYNPVNTSNVDFVQLSQFIINSSDVNSSKWANPRFIGTNNDVANIWFSQTVDQPIGLCGSFIKSITKSNKLVIEGTFGTFWNLPNTGWEAKLHTYGRLYEYPELRPSGSAALTWYNANINSSPAQLYKVMTAMRDLGAMPSVTDAAVANFDALLEQRNVKEGQLLTPGLSLTQITQTKQELDALNTLFVAAQLSMNNAINSDAAATASQRQLLLTTLNGLTLSTSYEQDLQSVLKIILEGYAANFIYTGTPLSTLTTIANKCRLEGGFAVVLARGALGINLINPLVDNTCGVGNRNDETTESQSLQSSVYPNPTTGEFIVQWSTPSDQVRVLLMDVLGRTLQTWNTSGTSLSINDAKVLTPGLYLLSVEAAGNKTETHKLLINHQ
jgi:Secretion system C-terminal sorting domain